ncbi:S-adenosylmethionine:tRNA ribosyltransferase-isomerase [Nitrospira japonica]|uniref:S-adenosylmethionine:tRNA ribosyltransferase-isomerase n=1 Tax=Nitrospira japonica TaxID=1325564 RepID=A0A1W1I5C1_9BACT|nr:tRNA preQ1(34) S-adenosylmethionine ribosyltransferase-isomerase QueA [Nitrospira japonica]SLM48196.1 S-adenosylmethionine:tRNA ribosyltransferase-isomerase [Nitrospira japonica]
MQVAEFDFPFDPRLVASEPVLPRDQAKLLVLPASHRSSHSMMHHRVADLPHLLAPGDLIVVNDTKVMPVRLTGRKQPTGNAVDILFVREVAEGLWEVLIKGRLRPGQRIDLGVDGVLEVQSRDRVRTVVRLDCAMSPREFFARWGMMPLPPYIDRAPGDMDREWYQTVFAQEEGAIAAPTAGLHFTPELLTRLNQAGIGVARVTLHVGIGTFKPITTDHVEDHRMGSEWFEVGAETVQAIAHTKEKGGRIVAVGTTVVRALETAAARQGALGPQRGETSLFITPGFSFQVVDALMTNFHLPKTTLLMLVSAFAGTSLLRQAYEEAVRERYRFYSYGDAMLILKS